MSILFRVLNWIMSNTCTCSKRGMTLATQTTCTCISTQKHCIALRYKMLHYIISITLLYLTFYYECIPLPCISLHNTLHCIALNYNSYHYFRLQYIHTHIHTCMNTLHILHSMHTCINSNKSIHAYMHTCTLANIHTHHIFFLGTSL